MNLHLYMETSKGLEENSSLNLLIKNNCFFYWCRTVQVFRCGRNFIWNFIFWLR